jgi:predicted amidohydrolase YtcJ
MPPADSVLKNARVITMDAARPSANLVAVDGDTISCVGTGYELESLAGPGTRIIDCGGKAVLPGFNDAHLHLFSLVHKLLGIDLTPASVRSIADIKEKIHEKAQETSPGTWISGAGYDEFYLAEKRSPTRRDLDEVAPDHPVVLSHRSLHEAVLNSLALSLAGITIDTEEPPGARIERDPATGEPNGIVFGMLETIHRDAMPPITATEFDKGVGLANKLFLSQGITSLQDATVSNGLARWETVCDLVLNRRLRNRVTFMAGASHWRDFEKMGLKTGSGDNLMRLGPVKIMPGVPRDQAKLNEVVREVHQAGFQLAFHAVAESEVAVVTEALEYIAQYAPVKGRRHRIEHCSECPPHLLERLGKMGVVVVTQPPFIYASGERYLATVPQSQLPWLYRTRSLLESGMVVAGSSDAPVAPENPLLGIYAAVTRRAGSGQVLLPEERISLEQALALYTVNGAYASFEEDIKGSLSPGKLADMVVLSADPLSVEPERIKDIKVEMTIIGGEVVWEA